jgi:hypothetical protein
MSDRHGPASRTEDPIGRTAQRCACVMRPDSEHVDSESPLGVVDWCGRPLRPIDAETSPPALPRSGAAKQTARGHRSIQAPTRQPALPAAPRRVRRHTGTEGMLSCARRQRCVRGAASVVVCGAPPASGARISGRAARGASACVAATGPARALPTTDLAPGRAGPGRTAAVTGRVQTLRPRRGRRGAARAAWRLPAAAARARIPAARRVCAPLRQA